MGLTWGLSQQNRDMTWVHVGNPIINLPLRDVFLKPRIYGDFGGWFTIGFTTL
jgi:hypothetical protein